MDALENIKLIYGRSDSKIAVTDADFAILWKNSSDVPLSVTPADFHAANDSVLRLPLLNETVLRHRSGSAVKITPLFCGEDIDGYILNFFDIADIGLLSCHSDMVNFQNNFLGNIRLELSEIIGMLDGYRNIYGENDEFSAADSRMRYYILRAFSATANFNEISKYYAGDIPFEFLNLSERLEETLLWAAPQFENNMCRIKSNIEPQIYANVNYNRIEAALLNLMINSFMYGDAAHKEIDISLKSDENHIYLTISDNGTSADVDRIISFSKQTARIPLFSQNEALGTAIARRAAEYFGGEILFEKSPTGGLSVKIVLPKNFGDLPKVFKLRRLPPIISQFDLQNCILSKGFDPIQK